MTPWKCLLCCEMVDPADVLSGRHLRIMHPDEEPPERWPDGEVVIWDDPDDFDDLVL